MNRFNKLLCFIIVLCLLLIKHHKQVIIVFTDTGNYVRNNPAIIDRQEKYRLTSVILIFLLALGGTAVVGWLCWRGIEGKVGPLRCTWF